MRRLLLTVLCLLVALPAGADDSRSFQDMLGRTVTMPEPADRIALFGGPTGQIAYILGVRDKICAVSKALSASELARDMDPGLADVPAPRGSSGHINVEELLVARPQLVVAGDLDGSIIERKTDIPVAYFDSGMSQGFDLLRREISFYADVFQAHERARRFIDYLDRTLALVRDRTADIPENERKSVFCGYSPSHLVSLGGDTFMQERIETAGCRNAAQEIQTTGKKEGLHTGLAEVSLELVLGWNPDILIIDFGQPEELYADPRFGVINAVKNRQVFQQPVGVFIWHRPTAESAVLHPLWLAATAYPERFADIDLVEEVKGFYAEIFDFPLSRQQAERILSGGYAVHYGRGRNKP